MSLTFVRIEQEKRQKQDNLSNGRKWQVLEHPSVLLSMLPVPTASAGAQLHGRVLARSALQSRGIPGAAEGIRVQAGPMGALGKDT